MRLSTLPPDSSKEDRGKITKITELEADGYRGLIMNQKTITHDMTIEELVAVKPEAINFLFQKGIRCIRCGEPVWDTIAAAARKKDFSEAEIDQLLLDLNNLD